LIDPLPIEEMMSLLGQRVLRALEHRDLDPT
jgi:hypothetical protein